MNIIRGDEKDESGISINKDIVFNELLKNYDNINNQVSVLKMLDCPSSLICWVVAESEIYVDTPIILLGVCWR